MSLTSISQQCWVVVVSVAKAVWCWCCPTNVLHQPSPLRYATTHSIPHSQERKMGMPMMDIHAPSVASRERSDSDLPIGVASDKSSLMELIAEKDRVDSELRALSSVLNSVSVDRTLRARYIDLTHHLSLQHGVNMNTSLTTFDGYPRDDLDIAQSV